MLSEEIEVPVLDVHVSDMSAAILAISNALQTSSATTHHEFQGIVKQIVIDTKYKSVRSGSEIVARVLSKELGKILSRDPKSPSPMASLAKYCETLNERWLQGPEKIARFLLPFLMRASAVLVHGHNKVICDALILAAGKRVFTVYFTEGNPFGSGARSVEYIQSKLAGGTGGTLRTVVVPDAAVGSMMCQVDFVLCGASAVTMNGGTVNVLGTLQTSVLAKNMGKDMYVITQTFKFTKSFPLRSADVRYSRPPSNEFVTPVDLCVPLVEYIPPENIKMLFTDMGVFPPATAADELYNIFQGEIS